MAENVQYSAIERTDYILNVFQVYDVLWCRVQTKFGRERKENKILNCEIFYLSGISNQYRHEVLPVIISHTDQIQSRNEDSFPPIQEWIRKLSSVINITPTRKKYGMLIFLFGRCNRTQNGQYAYSGSFVEDGEFNFMIM